jgi:hypothetical protein
LEGPGGPDGHQWNEPGFDGVAYRFRDADPLEIHILDNKSHAAEGNVPSATALTRNLRQNLEDLIQRVGSSQYDQVPKIADVRSKLNESLAAIRGGSQLPPEVKLIVTAYGGRREGVTESLQAQGVTFKEEDSSEIGNEPELQGGSG